MVPSLPLLPYFVLAHWIKFHHKYWIYQNIWQAKAIKIIIKLYPDHNNLWVKHVTHQKAESLRAGFLSKLDNTVNSNSISNTKYAGFSTEWYVLLHYHNPICAYNHPFILHQELVPLLQWTCSQNLTILSSTPFLYISAIFHFPIFAYNHSNNLHQKYFPYLSHLANSGYVKGPGNQRVFWELTQF